MITSKCLLEASVPDHKKSSKIYIEKNKKQALRVEMRGEGKKERKKKQQQLISIKTDCQTRWGLLENWGTVDEES